MCIHCHQPVWPHALTTTELPTSRALSRLPPGIQKSLLAAVSLDLCSPLAFGQSTGLAAVACSAQGGAGGGSAFHHPLTRAHTTSKHPRSHALRAVMARGAAPPPKRRQVRGTFSLVPAPPPRCCCCCYRAYLNDSSSAAAHSIVRLVTQLNSPVTSYRLGGSPALEADCSPAGTTPGTLIIQPSRCSHVQAGSTC